MNHSDNNVMLEIKGVLKLGNRESMHFNVVIVGAGPAGLASAIKIKQLALKANQDISVCVLEKGSEVGAHILSGAVMDSKALEELFPEWQAKGAPLNTKVTKDKFIFLSKNRSLTVPNFLLPKCFKNNGNYIISLGTLCRWMGRQAEDIGVEIYPGFAATEVLFNEYGGVVGVATGSMGLNKNGEKSSSFEEGMEIRGDYTFFAEGCRGHLGKSLISHFGLDSNSDNQVYGIGLKELWEVDPALHEEGLVMHTAGWPLENNVYGGSYLYHLEKNQISVGFVLGLGYSNPYLSPFEEFQRYKTHPKIRRFFKNGKRISYGARAITAGGWQSLPKLTFPGGCLVGDNAGFLNASRIKGSHCAIKSGILAAESVFEALSAGRQHDELLSFIQKYKKSWLSKELYQARNFKPWMSKGIALGSLMVGIDQILLRGKAPWTLSHGKSDHSTLENSGTTKRIKYPKPDGEITFDRLSSVYLSNTNHRDNQPVHLRLGDPTKAININYKEYDSPEQRYCPAGVYEIVEDPEKGPSLHINSQNCVHCKTCDIKDPGQNITWVAPEGGGGPNYSNM